MYKCLAAALHLKKQCNVLKKLKLKPTHELQPARMIFSLQVSKTKLTPGVHRDLKANYVVQRPGESMQQRKFVLNQIHGRQQKFSYYHTSTNVVRRRLRMDKLTLIAIKTVSIRIVITT